MFSRLSNRRKLQACIFIAFLSAIPFVASANSTGPPAGSAGDNPPNTCGNSGCHTNNSGAALPTVLLTGAPGSYTPGQTYNLTVTVSHALGTRGGFQLVVLNSGGNSAGTLIADSDTALTSPAARRYISHNGSSTSQRSWTFQWTAPAAGTGTVTFFVAGLAATGATLDSTLNDVFATITQSSQEMLPTLSISDVQVTEGNTGTVAATFMVSLSFQSAQTVTVNVSTANNTAAAPGDFDSVVSQQVSIPAGSTSQNVTVNVRGDTIDEPNETFFVNLSSPSGATLGDSQGVGTILDNDPTPSISINDVSLNEGNSGTSNANFVVSLSNARSVAITVNFATASGTATAPGDYAATSGTLTFDPGVTQQIIMVQVNGDATNEPGETFFVNLSSPNNATISDSQGQCTILNDDAPCTYTIFPTSQSFSAGGDVGSIDVTAPGGCAWNAISNAPWIMITTGSSGSGNGAVGYSVIKHTGACDRTGTITVAGQTFTVTQSASIPDADCDGIPDSVEAAEGTDPSVKDNDIFLNARLFAMQQYRDFLGREGEPGGVTFWTNQISSGSLSRAQVIDSFFQSPEFQGSVSPVARLYFAYFLRIPDYEGLLFWVNQYRGGAGLGAISEAFAQSPEFISTYGSLTNLEFVTLVYNNVLGRAPEAEGLAFWVGQLETGAMTRGEVMLGFSESPEYRQRINNEVYVVMMYVGMLRRAPEQEGFNFWVGQMDSGASGLSLIQGFLDAPEYHSRFLP